jgi:tripartite-type tricarboxylate transporter receptor subunit TctC
MMPRISVAIISFGMMLAAAQMTSGQDYPNRAIRVVAAAPGGGADIMARLIAQGVTAGLGQQVVIDNRGGSVVIPSQMVAQAAPDGYTLLFYGNPFWLFPLMRDHTPYDPVKDFSPITLAASSPNVLVVHPSLPVKSVKELIALAKAKPGQLNYGSGVPGGSPQLSAELFKSMAGVNIIHIPYKGTGPSITALIGGETQLMFASATAVAQHVKAGRLRALAVTSARPTALAPGLPTVSASGLPGYESAFMLGIFAPARTPAAIINRLNQEIVRVLNRADLKDRFFNAGVDVVGSSPERLAAAVESDIAVMGKVIRDAGIRAE